ncbi:MAG TPA: hypothetical protein VIY48_12710 [Candidatus Paceibacterota bacterium]
MPVAPGLNSKPKPKSVIPSKRDPIPEAMLTVMLEVLAVGLFTLMAGASSEMGTLMIVFMTGFWLMYLITNASVLQKLEEALRVA